MRSKPALGINLSGISDWATELPFVDAFKMSRPWISQRRGSSWGSGPPLELDSYGWVRRLEPDCYAETLIYSSRVKRYPGGIYTLLYEGEGQIECAGPLTERSRQPGRIELEVRANTDTLFLRLRQTNPKNYMRNIRLIMPGFEKLYQTNPFHPLFLNRWRGVACFRFMDWGNTNNSKLRTWNDRPRLEDATYMLRGVPIELMIDLCNRLKVDAWFCVPHQADDLYVRQLAQLVNRRLAPDRKVYLEYSNETWNSIFEQYTYAGNQGIALGFATTLWEGAWRYHAHRAVQIFRLWEQEVGRRRLVRVLASHSENPYATQQILEFQNAYRSADALAIAPYFGPIVTPNSDPPESVVQNWTAQEALDYLERVSLPRTIKHIQEHANLVRKYGLKLVAYEGGIHFVGAGGAENNEKITQLCMEVNRHPQLYRLYRQYLDAWARAGGDLFCYFASVSEWSKWGCWGVMEYYDEDPRRSPKFRALIDWARQQGQAINYP